MFAKMKTGSKVLAGFGIALTVAVICGLRWLPRHQKTVIHIDEIAGNRMPSVESLQDIKIGSEQIERPAHPHLILDMDLLTRQRQYRET